MIKDINQLNREEEAKAQNLAMIQNNALANVQMKVHAMMLNILFGEYLEQKGHGITNELEPMLEQFDETLVLESIDESRLPFGVTLKDVQRAHQQAKAKIFHQMREIFKK